MGVIISKNKTSELLPGNGEGGEGLMRLVMLVSQELRLRKLFMTTVESCTGGGLANAMTNIAGASEVIGAGFIVYSIKQMVALGVPAKLIKQHGVYSLEAAESLASVGLKNDKGRSVAVGITGSISRIDPANPNSEPGVVYIAVKFGKKTVSRKAAFEDSGERWEVKERAICEALKMVLDILNLKGG